MKRTILTLVAATFAAVPFIASASDTTPASRTADLLRCGQPVRIAQVNVRVVEETPPPHYHHHHRHYHTVKVVKYRHGEKYVTYRRVYD